MGAIVCLLVIIVAIFADAIAPYPYDKMGTGERFEKPSWEHPFGTDNYQRDIFSRVVYGAQISISVGLVCVAISVGIGVPCGLISGFAGKGVDMFFMRICDVFLSIPYVLMAITATTIFGPGIHVVYITMGLVHAPGILRLTRSMVLSVRERAFIQAAQQLGESKGSIMFRYILPNCLSAIIIRATTILAGAVLSEAAISYLGYGVQPPSPSWGLMLTDSQGYIYQAPLMAVFPGIAIVLLVLSVNMFGDGLRDLMDPKFKGRVMN
jgi:peptide/nickel transport system permease protein